MVWVTPEWSQSEDKGAGVLAHLHLAALVSSWLPRDGIPRRHFGSLQRADLTGSSSHLADKETPVLGDPTDIFCHECIYLFVSPRVDCSHDRPLGGDRHGAEAPGPVSLTSVHAASELQSSGKHPAFLAGAET